MKLRAVSIGLIPVLVIAAFLAAIPLRAVSAQICYDAQHPNGFPCPEEQRKKPTVIYPSFTPTSTSTPTASPTAIPSPASMITPIPTSTPASVLWIFASGPGPANGPGGFNCPPYVGSVPLGAGVMGLGLLILASRARILTGMTETPSTKRGKGLDRRERGELERRTQTSRDAAARSEEMKAAEEPSSILFVIREFMGAVGVAIVAVVIAAYTFGAGVGQLFIGAIKPSTGQGFGSTASGLAGTGVAGTGAGILGSALFGGLLGFDCISTYVMLPSGAALGLIAGIAASLIPRSGR